MPGCLAVLWAQQTSCQQIHIIFTQFPLRTSSRKGWEDQVSSIASPSVFSTPWYKWRFYPMCIVRITAKGICVNGFEESSAISHIIYAKPPKLLERLHLFSLLFHFCILCFWSTSVNLGLPVTCIFLSLLLRCTSKWTILLTLRCLGESKAWWMHPYQICVLRLANCNHTTSVSVYMTRTASDTLCVSIFYSHNPIIHI